MSVEDLKKVIQDSGLTMSPGGADSIGDGTNGIDSCTFCEASWGCLLGGACASGCDAYTGCESGCWAASCNADCNAGMCACSYD